MTDRPIIFSAPMVRALLDGRKTQTRRIATSPLRRCEPGDRLWVRETCAAEELSRPPQTVKATALERKRYGRTTVIACDEEDGADGVRYLADDAWAKIENTPDAGEAWGVLFHYGFKDGRRPSGLRGKSVPSIHMPRWASRLTLIVEAVRVEPLQAISDSDCLAEGIEPLHGELHDRAFGGDTPCTRNAGLISYYGAQYRNLWNSLHGRDSWAANPDVIVPAFRVVRGNIDRIKG